jgi:outer membrane protein assembly factor BamA
MITRRSSNIFGIAQFHAELLKDASKKKIPVQPFYQERVNQHFKSPLEEYIMQIAFVQNEKLTRQEIIEMTQTKKDMAYWKGRLEQEQLTTLQKDFKAISYDGIISLNKILEYLGFER